MVETSYPWEVGALPFVFRPLYEPTNGGEIPDFICFSFDLDKDTGTLLQLKNEYVEEILLKAYLRGSEISGMMDDHGIGELYANDFLQFLSEPSRHESFINQRILEIGCGTGYLLSLLKMQGANVLGIEPGDHGQEGSRRFHIPIVQDFFPSPKISGKFDVIILYALLEHITDPVKFLEKVSEFLNPSGKIVISVPNCEPYIESGDISFILHEHWSYFSPGSLKNTISQANLSLSCLKKSQFAEIIYAEATLEVNKCKEKPVLLNNTITAAEIFKVKFQKNLESFSILVSSLTTNNTVGFYVPGRAINVLSLILSKINLSNLRFFDDNPKLHRTYYPGIDVPIENRQDLLQSPPDVIIIFSHSFGKKIKADILQSGIQSPILLMDDIFKG